MAETESMGAPRIPRARRLTLKVIPTPTISVNITDHLTYSKIDVRPIHRVYSSVDKAPVGGRKYGLSHGDAGWAP